MRALSFKKVFLSRKVDCSIYFAFIHVRTDSLCSHRTKDPPPACRYLRRSVQTFLYYNTSIGRYPYKFGGTPATTEPYIWSKRNRVRALLFPLLFREGGGKVRRGFSITCRPFVSAAKPRPWNSRCCCWWWWFRCYFDFQKSCVLCKTYKTKVAHIGLL